MEGVTTALVLAIFAGVYWPQAVKNRQQFYFAIGAVLLIILFAALNGAILSVGFARFASVMIGILQIIGVLAVILATSGQTVGEFADDTIEVVRRGEVEKEILIKGAGARRARERDAVDESGRIDLGSTDEVGRTPVRPNNPPPPAPGPIPLDE